jgi:hypothetical protein
MKTVLSSDVETGFVSVKPRKPFSGRNRSVILCLLVGQQQGRCFYGFDCCTSQLTVIAHKDHNPANDSPDNLAASCPKCNKRISNLARRDLQQRSSEESVGVKDSVGDEDSMEKNLRTENAWVEWVFDKLKQLSPGIGLPKHDLTGESAYAIGLSVATVDRHWKKYGSSLGPFLTFRPKKGTRLLVRLREQS